MIREESIFPLIHVSGRAMQNVKMLVNKMVIIQDLNPRLLMNSIAEFNIVQFSLIGDYLNFSYSTLES